MEGLVVKHRALISTEKNWLDVKMMSEVKGVTAKQYDILRQDYGFNLVRILDEENGPYWHDKRLNILPKLHGLLFSPEGGVSTIFQSLCY